MDSLYNSNNELIIKPKNDVIFKKLFIENEDLLQDLVAMNSLNSGAGSTSLTDVTCG